MSSSSASAIPKAGKKLKVAFIHPDLGIGGAEQLVVNAALSLQRRGHEVVFFTAHHDKEHCFDETRDGTLPVRVHGDWFPRSFCGKMTLVCAIIRTLLAALACLFSFTRYDVIIVDQVPAVIPYLRLSRSKIIFYCHFPDKMLSQPGSSLKSCYRGPLDWLEETTTGMAHLVLVNSQYTASVFEKAFPSLHRRGLRPSVLYPAIDFTSFRQLPLVSIDKAVPELNLYRRMDFRLPHVLLSLNRFERKKHISLAVKALDHLRHSEMLPPGFFDKLVLIIAGGYDPLVQENVEHMEELKELVNSLKLSEKVLFLPNITSVQRLSLLAHSQAVLYTPPNEHFGIVPIEAMFAGTPVIACESGGPLETVINGDTGYLCDPTPAAFSNAIARLLSDPARSKEMGRLGNTHVKENFSLEAFGTKLNGFIDQLLSLS
eukprot:GILI01005483.1.p1 GENE.GILI01005483.1~~GILI01005483.1.p1  ORF type:complete len:444 (+),score=143.04 GILI01005483.1:43-1332(+)